MNGRPWTADDSAKLRRLAQAGMNDAEIGRALGRDRTCIVRKRAQMGIERGMSVLHIAALARCNARRRALVGQPVAAVVDKLGMPSPPCPATPYTLCLQIETHTE